MPKSLLHSARAFRAPKPSVAGAWCLTSGSLWELPLVVVVVVVVVGLLPVAVQQLVAIRQLAAIRPG